MCPQISVGSSKLMGPQVTASSYDGQSQSPQTDAAFMSLVYFLLACHCHSKILDSYRGPVQISIAHFMGLSFLDPY